MANVQDDYNCDFHLASEEKTKTAQTEAHVLSSGFPIDAVLAISQ